MVDLTSLVFSTGKLNLPLSKVRKLPEVLLVQTLGHTTHNPLTAHSIPVPTASSVLEEPVQLSTRIPSGIRPAVALHSSFNEGMVVGNAIFQYPKPTKL